MMARLTLRLYVLIVLNVARSLNSNTFRMLVLHSMMVTTPAVGRK